jgi:hypothetical protein
MKPIHGKLAIAVQVCSLALAGVLTTGPAGACLIVAAAASWIVGVHAMALPIASGVPA